MLTDIRALADHFLIALPNINSEPITFLAQVSFLGLLRIFEGIDKLSLGVLPMGQSILRCPFPRQV